MAKKLNSFFWFADFTDTTNALASLAPLRRAEGLAFHPRAQKRMIEELDCEFSEARLGCPLASADRKAFGVSHDLIQLLEQLNLLIDQQFRVTDDVD